MRKILSLFLSLILFLNLFTLFLPGTAYAVCYATIYMPDQIYSSSSFQVTVGGITSGQYGLLIKDNKNNLWIDKPDGHRANTNIPISTQTSQGEPIYFGAFNAGGTQNLELIPNNSYTFYVSKMGNVLGWDHCGGDQTRTVQSGTAPSPRTNTCTAYQTDVLDEDGRVLAEKGHVSLNDCETNYEPKVIQTVSEYVCSCQLTSTPAPSIPNGPCKGGLCNTAFGNITTDPAGFVKDLFGILLSLSGGIAIVLIMISGYSLMFSQGNPEKVQAAREQLTSAIVGLLFIIFSITILQIIGVDILHIPGFK